MLYINWLVTYLLTSCLVGFNTTITRAYLLLLDRHFGFRFITVYNYMLFCRFQHNVESSCHKHFVIVSCHQQTPPLTATSDKCHKLPWSGGTVLITPRRLQRWQHTMKQHTGRESSFLPAPQAFDGLIRRVPVIGGATRYAGYAEALGMRKHTHMWSRVC